MTRGLLKILSQILDPILFALVEDDWIQTYSGHKFFFKNPKPEQICLEDIAHVLSVIPRYGGHSINFLSVAEHSVAIANCFRGFPKNLQLAALFHDAPEAYIGDLVTPLKRMIPTYKRIESRIIQAIAKKYGFTWNRFVEDTIKIADKRMFVTEVKQLCKEECLQKWYRDQDPYPIQCHFWTPDEAKFQFIARFGELENSSN